MLKFNPQPQNCDANNSSSCHFISYRYCLKYCLLCRSLALDLPARWQKISTFQNSTKLRLTSVCVQPNRFYFWHSEGEPVRKEYQKIQNITPPQRKLPIPKMSSCFFLFNVMSMNPQLMLCHQCELLQYGAKREYFSVWKKKKTWVLRYSCNLLDINRWHEIKDKTYCHLFGWQQADCFNGDAFHLFSCQSWQNNVFQAHWAYTSSTNIVVRSLM